MLTCFKLVDTTVTVEPPLPSQPLVDLQLADDLTTLVNLITLVKIGTVSERTSKVFKALQSAGTSLQHFAKRRLPCVGERINASKKARQDVANIWELFTIIYGRPGLFDPIGEYLTECRLYLQDPFHCDRNVELRNAHRCSRNDGKVIYTSSAYDEEDQVDVQACSENPLDFLESIGDVEALSEMSPPPTIRTTLLRCVSFLRLLDESLNAGHFRWIRPVTDIFLDTRSRR